MIKILFVCHGNVCRSTMAEYIMKHLVEKSCKADKLYIDSAATSSEELGSPVHPGTRRKLLQAGIPCGSHRARLLRREEYDEFDLIIGMDDRNMRGMLRIFGGDPEGKLHVLLDYADRPGQGIADPWYTGDFDATFADVTEGCRGLLRYLETR